MTLQTRNNVQSSKSSSKEVKDALETFLASPSFNTKQIALESFLEHIIVGEISISSQES